MLKMKRTIIISAFVLFMAAAAVTALITGDFDKNSVRISDGISTYKFDTDAEYLLDKDGEKISVSVQYDPSIGKMENLKELNISVKPTDDLAALAGCTSLETLGLTYFGASVTLDTLPAMPSLKNLQIICPSCTVCLGDDFSEKIPNAEYIYIFAEGGKFENNLGLFADAENLTDLLIHCNNSIDFTGIGDLSSLVNAEFTSGDLSGGYSALKDCESIEKLFILISGKDDIRDISLLPNLRELTLIAPSENVIVDDEMFAGFDKLEKLGVTGFKVNDADDLKIIPGLQELSIYGNTIISADEIEKLEKSGIKTVDKRVSDYN